MQLEMWLLQYNEADTKLSQFYDKELYYTTQDHIQQHEEWIWCRLLILLVESCSKLVISVT